MNLPVEYYVSQIDLSPSDAFLPLFETVVNAVISLQQTNGKFEKKIEIHIEREGEPDNKEEKIKTNLLDDYKPIKSIKVIDNGEGFSPANLKSYQTAYTRKNINFGCKGVGRFTILAAFEKIEIESIYVEGDKYKEIQLDFDQANEVLVKNLCDSEANQRKTIVSLKNLYNKTLKDATAKSIDQIAEELMSHCLIFYLCNNLPEIEFHESGQDKPYLLSEKFESLKKDREREFNIGGESFKCHITKSERTNNRKYHYSHYCANSRVVGGSRNLAQINTLFMYPLLESGCNYFLDVYIVSDYLNKKVYNSRNGFSIPHDKNHQLFDDDCITFNDIDQRLVDVLTKEYSEYAQQTQEKNVERIKDYIQKKAPQYKRFSNRPDILNSLPPNLTEEKLEELLHKEAYRERQTIEKRIQDFIEKKDINEEAILSIKQGLAEKNALDKDSLADYMTRRKAIIEIFKKFLEADSQGKYKLEEDIHNLIFPMGITSDEPGSNSHNLWLLDERFTSYTFVASDKPITSFSQKKSKKEPDLILLNEKPEMFNNPISFAPNASGELHSLVVFEFKRPGEIAHQKKSKDYRWEFSELIEPYFEDFIYSPDKKNYRGKHVLAKTTTPKFGFVIIDVLPTPLRDYNLGKGWDETPFGTLYKIQPKQNLHIEVITFDQLIKAVEARHTPFFDKLFS